jgi:ABC-2 type transport system permease protein
MRTLRFLLKKEFLQIVRDHVMLRLIIVVPVVQLIILSNAATFEVKRSQMYVVDDDRSELSRGLLTRLTSSGRFVLREASPSMEGAREAMLRRRVDVIVRIPADFERDLIRARRAPVQIVVNAENGAAAGVTQSYASQIMLAYAAELGSEITPSLSTAGATAERVPRPGVPNLEVRARGWYNADLNYRDYMVPGILVLLVTIIGTMLTAMNIVREKEIGTLEQLNVTPITRGTFITAKLVPLWTIAMLELTVGLLIARFLFDVPMRGSIPLVFAGAAIYLVAALGIGLWISTLAETQQQAMFVAFFVMMVYLLMSGLFTPLRSMPQWAQWMAQLNPVMHFIAMMRAILLKGAGLADVYPKLVILAAYGGVVVTLAVRQYAKRTA